MVKKGGKVGAVAPQLSIPVSFLLIIPIFDLVFLSFVFRIHIP
jgi:hypothetical protein